MAKISLQPSLTGVDPTRNRFEKVAMNPKKQITFSIRKARIEDAPILAEAEREIARQPGLLVSQPHELPDERFTKKIA